MAGEYEHIVFSRELDGQRRRHANPSPPPDRGLRKDFAPRVRSAIQSVVDQRKRQPVAAEGVAPHLVVRVPLDKSVSLEAITASIERTGLTVVGVEPDNAVIAFNESVELDQLLGDVARFEKGPRFNYRTGEPGKSTTADYLLYVEPDGIVTWSAEDRTGPRLAEMAGADGSTIDPDAEYLVDVDVWFLGADAQKRSISEVQSCLDSGSSGAYGAITDVFEDQTSTVLRIACSGRVVSRLLSLDAVAEVELPTHVEFDVTDAILASADDLPSPPSPLPGGPSVCVLDTGVTEGHPLLAQNLGDAQTFITAGSSASDDQGHGTFVSGLAVFGDVRGAYVAHHFASPIMLYSGKVLTADGYFDDQSLPATQIRDAVDYFTRQYGCRVFNLSVGCKTAALTGDGARVSTLAEAIDSISREYKVLFVLPSGNHNLTAGLPQATQPEERYPGLLLQPEAGVSDPGTSAISLTVGGLAEYDAPDYMGASVPVALRRQPSPIARSGPGYRRAVKPELVHYSGNLIVASTSQGDQVLPNPATSVMSLSAKPANELFSFGIGTSHAAPQVSRLASLVMAELPQYVGTPDPNLVRALLAASASHPTECDAVLAGLQGDAATRLLGYGFPDEDAALGSDAKRVTLITQAQIPVDGYHIYAVPVPDAFRRAGGVRSITIAIAHDPMTRRRHKFYLGAEMDFILVRGKTLAEVSDSVRDTDSGEEMVPALESPWRCNLMPSGNPREGCCRQASTLQKAVVRWRQRERRDYGDTYYLVVRCKRRWMPRGHMQDYGLAVVLESNDDRLHQQVRDQIRLRSRTRVRPRVGA